VVSGIFRYKLCGLLNKTTVQIAKQKNNLCGFWSASELYRPTAAAFPAKLLSAFAGKGYFVVNFLNNFKTQIFELLAGILIFDSLMCRVILNLKGNLVPVLG
jgi:hypothetical protein